jgi:hypothetical protein
MGSSDSYLTEEQFDLIKEQIEKIKKTINEHSALIDAL